MEAAIVTLSVIGFVAFFVRGATGAASAIVFNAAFVLAVPLGLAGGLSLLAGLYWMALANAFASLVLLGLLARSIRLDAQTLLLLAGLLPSNVVFTLLLPNIDVRGLELFMGIAVCIGGVYLLRADGPLRIRPEHARRAALPVGAGAGVLGGLFGMAGPVLMLVLGRSTESPSEFRSQFTTITAASNFVRVVVLASQGVYGSLQTHLFIGAAPAVIAGLLAGFVAHRYISPALFRSVLGALVELAGVAAVVQSLRIIG